MDSQCDPDDPPTTFDDPNLSSTYAYGAEFFGVLIGYKSFGEVIGHEMLETKNVAPWSLEDLGYTNDAHHVDADGRIDGPAHPPDYYAYSPCMDIWEEGLQEIEDFDWSADKEDNQHADNSDSKGRGEKDVQAADGVDTLGPVDHNHDLDLVHDDTAHILGRADSPTTQSENFIQVLKDFLPASGTASITMATETTALPAFIKHSEPNPPAVGDQHVEAQDAMDIDDVSVAADTRWETISPRMGGDVTARQEIVPMPGLAAHQEEYVASDIMVWTKLDAGLNNDDAVEALTVTSAPASSYHKDLIIHESGFEIPLHIVQASEVQKTDTAIESELLTSPHPGISCENGEAAYSVSEKTDQQQTQRYEPKAQDQLPDDSAVQVQFATDTLRSPSDWPLKAPALLSHSKAKSVGNTPEVGSEHTTVDPVIPSMLNEDDPVSPKSPGVLSRLEENVDGPWQAQLRNAADEVSTNSLSELSPLGYCDHNVHSFKLHSELITDEASMRASSPLSASTSEQQLENSLALPPLPFTPENDAEGNERSEVSPAEAAAAKNNASATALPYRPLNPRSPFNIKSLNARAEDHVAVPDFANGKTTVAIPEDDLVEDGSFNNDQDAVEDPGSTTPLGSSLPPTTPLDSPLSVLAPIAPLVHPRKRLKPSKKAKNASETDSDAPPRKTARKSKLAKPRASRARKPSNGGPLSETSDPRDRNNGPEGGNHDSEGGDEDFEDAQETIEARGENDEADDDYTDTPLPARKKPKPKNKSLMLDDQSMRQSNSHTGTPRPSTASPIPAPTTNKYGFKPSFRGPRTRKALKEATSSQFAPAPAAKLTVPAKRKAKTTRGKAAADAEKEEEEEEEEEGEEAPTLVPKPPAKAMANGPTAPVATATPQPAHHPSARKTRRASAMEDGVTHAREEQARLAKETVRAEARARLRRKK